MQVLLQSGSEICSMETTSQQTIREVMIQLTSLAEVLSADEQVALRSGRDRRRTSPFSHICCGLSRIAGQLGFLWSNQPQWIATSSWNGPQNWNAVVTGSQHELLIANTGCPRGAPDVFSSEGWAELGWSYGLTYTLTASEWKGRTYKGARASDSMGTVPTVCEAEYLQGFRRGALHSCAREMLSLSRSQSGSAKES